MLTQISDMYCTKSDVFGIRQHVVWHI